MKKVLSIAVIFIVLLAIAHHQGFFASKESKVTMSQITSNSLAQPVLTEAQVGQWAASVARTVYTYDYTSYQADFENASKKFTTQGWKAFQEALKASKNLNAVIKRKFRATAVSTQPANIIDKKVVDGRYTWTVKIPVLVTYQSQQEKLQTPLQVTLTVVRAAPQQFPDGVVVEKFAVQSGLK